MAWKRPSRPTDPPARASFLQSVGGGGCPGRPVCELAALLVADATAHRRRFQAVARWSSAGWLAGEVRVGIGVAQQFIPASRRRQGSNLARNGVELCLGSMVGAIEPRQGLVKEKKGGTPPFLEAATSAGPLGCGPHGSKTDWRAQRAALWIASAPWLVEPDFSVAGQSGARVWAIPLPLRPTPATARRCRHGRPAVQMGSCGGDILRQIKGEVSPPFRLAGYWLQWR